MSYLIAVTGKGGVGKTTVAGLLIKRLIARGCGPLLAVDADPNMNLDLVLGVNVQNTVGRIREEARTAGDKIMSTGASKQEWLEYKISESLVESSDFDFIAMGRPEGPGCYCYANNILKDVINRMVENYPYIVIDNEAGLENLSRRIVRGVDLMIFVSDPSVAGLKTVDRLLNLSLEMNLRYAKCAVIINKISDQSFCKDFDFFKEKKRVNAFACFGYNSELESLGQRGSNLDGLSMNNSLFLKVDELLSCVGIKNKVEKAVS